MRKTARPITMEEGQWPTNAELRRREAFLADGRTSLCPMGAWFSDKCYRGRPFVGYWVLTRWGRRQRLFPTLGQNTFLVGSRAALGKIQGTRITFWRRCARDEFPRSIRGLLLQGGLLCGLPLLPRSRIPLVPPRPRRIVPKLQIRPMGTR